MESVASNSTSQENIHQRFHPRYKHTQAVAERIIRALRHTLLVLHRAESIFYVLGATGNVYVVTLSTSPSCTCPDRTIPCKHILFVYIRALGISLDDVCLRRRTLRPFQLNRLLRTPTLPDSLARASLCERFHQLFFRTKHGNLQSNVEVENGLTCPICLDEMGKEEKLVVCGTCNNSIHKECLLKWKRSRGRTSASCVICRARWKDKAEQDKYLNLAAYVSEDDAAEDEAGSCAG